jgi:hypothetical protein
VRRLLLVLLFAGLALASCGGGDDQEDVEDLLDRAFSQPMSSADLKLDVELELNGSASLDRPVRLVATGPFRTNVGKLPSVDIELEVGTDGAGQTVRTGFLSTGDRAFVKFQDVYYEQPAAEVRRANRTIRRSKSREGSLGALGLDPRSWLAGGKDEGEEEVTGVQTRHVSGSLDVEAFMRNLNEFVRTSGRALGGAAGRAAPEPLSAEDIQRIGEVVRDPTFDVYVGVDDDIIRRVSGRVEFSVPADSRQKLGGIESGSLEFTVEFADVNGDQEIEAPSDARPLSELTTSLGGGGALPGLGGGTPDAPKDAPAPETGTPAAPEGEDFREYADCLDKARPEDTDALQRCAELLQRP